MMRNKGLQEDDIQKLHTTAPEQLTDQELLLSTISVADLVRKQSGGWDKEHPKCLFCGKAYRHRTFTVQYHMTSQVTVSGKRKCETAVCNMERTKDDSPLKARFPVVSRVEDTYHPFVTSLVRIQSSLLKQSLVSTLAACVRARSFQV